MARESIEGKQMAGGELWVLCMAQEYADAAKALATRLQQPLKFDIDAASLAAPELVVVYDDQGVSLQHTGRKAPGPIRVDFAEGAVDHRRKFGGGKGQMIAKAVGVKSNVYPTVLDATAGLGKDAFVLATLGCTVKMLERSPIAFALLQDGLERGRGSARLENVELAKNLELGKESGRPEDPELAQILERMHLLAADSREYLEQISEEERPDVVYLDPMFPDRQKSADVKKEMAAFHQIIGKDEDSDALVERALAAAIYRVVVKRPRKAPFLADKTPSYQLEGKSSRYDIYTIKKMPEHLG